MKLFRRKIDAACAYCAHGADISEGFVNCSKKKRLMSPDEHCARFTYDPLKRVPVKQKALDFSKYEEYDFSL